MTSPTSTLLIVDDEPRGRELLGDLLTPHGYELRFAADGPEAIAAATAQPPDLILLDVMMPGMDGSVGATGTGGNANRRASRLVLR